MKQIKHFDQDKYSKLNKKAIPFQISSIIIQLINNSKIHQEMFGPKQHILNVTGRVAASPPSPDKDFIRNNRKNLKQNAEQFTITRRSYANENGQYVPVQRKLYQNQDLAMVDTRQAIERGLGDENKFQQWNSFQPMDVGRRFEFKPLQIETAAPKVQPVNQTRYFQIEIGRRPDEGSSGLSQFSVGQGARNYSQINQKRYGDKSQSQITKYGPGTRAAMEFKKAAATTGGQWVANKDMHLMQSPMITGSKLQQYPSLPQSTRQEPRATTARNKIADPNTANAESLNKNIAFNPKASERVVGQSIGIGSTIQSRPRTSRPDQLYHTRVNIQQHGLNQNPNNYGMTDRLSAKRNSRNVAGHASQQSTDNQTQGPLSSKYKSRAQSNYQNRTLLSRRTRNVEAAARMNDQQTKLDSSQVSKSPKSTAIKTGKEINKRNKPSTLLSSHKGAQYKLDDSYLTYDQPFNFTRTTTFNRGSIQKNRNHNNMLQTQQAQMIVGLKKKITGPDPREILEQRLQKQRIQQYETRNLLSESIELSRSQNRSRNRSRSKNQSQLRSNNRSQSRNQSDLKSKRREKPRDSKASKSKDRDSKAAPGTVALSVSSPDGVLSPAIIEQMPDLSPIDMQRASVETTGQMEVNTRNKSARSRERDGGQQLNTFTIDPKKLEMNNNNDKERQIVLHLDEQLQKPSEGAGAYQNQAASSQKNQREDGTPQNQRRIISPNESTVVTPINLQQRIFSSKTDLNNGSPGDRTNQKADVDYVEVIMQNPGSERFNDTIGIEQTNINLTQSRQSKGSKQGQGSQMKKHKRTTSALARGKVNRSKLKANEAPAKKGVEKPNKKPSQKKPNANVNAAKAHGNRPSVQAFAEAALEEDYTILKIDKNDIDGEEDDERPEQDGASEGSDDTLMSLGLGLGIKVPTYLAKKYRLRSAAAGRPQLRQAPQNLQDTAPKKQIESMAQLQVAQQPGQETQRVARMSLPTNCADDNMKSQQIQFYYARGFKRINQDQSTRMNSLKEVARSRMVDNGQSSNMKGYPLCLNQNNFLVSTKDLMSAQNLDSGLTKHVPQKRLQSAHPAQLPQQKRSSQHFLQSKEGLNIRNLLSLESKDCEAFLLTQKPSNQNLSKYRGSLPLTQKFKNSQSFKFIGMFNHPSAKNFDQKSPKRSQGAKEEFVKVLTLDPSIKDKLNQPMQVQQKSIKQVLGSGNEYCLQFDKADPPAAETLSQSSNKNKISTKRSFKPGSIANQYSDNKLLIIQPIREGSRVHNQSQKKAYEPEKEKQALNLVGGARRSHEQFRSNRPSPAAEGDYGSPQRNQSKFANMNQASWSGKPEVVPSIDNRSAAADLNMMLMTSEDMVSPNSHKNIKSINSNQNLTASRKSVLKKIHRKESALEAGVNEYTEKQLPRDQAQIQNKTSQQINPMLISDFEKNKAAINQTVQDYDARASIVNQDLVQVDYVAHRHDNITNIKIGPTSTNDYPMFGFGDQPGKQVLKQPTLLPYAQKEDKKRDNQMNRLVNSLDRNKESSVFPTGLQNVGLLATQFQRGARNLGPQMNSMNQASNNASSTYQLKSSSSRQKVEDVITARNSQRMKLVPKEEQILSSLQRLDRDPSLKVLRQEELHQIQEIERLNIEEESFLYGEAPDKITPNQRATKMIEGLNANSSLSVIDLNQESKEKASNQKESALPLAGQTGSSGGKGQPNSTYAIPKQGNKNNTNIVIIEKINEMLNDDSAYEEVTKNQNATEGENTTNQVKREAKGAAKEKETSSTQKKLALRNQLALATVPSVPSAHSHDKNNMKQMQEIADRFDGLSQDEYNSRSYIRSHLSLDRLVSRQPAEARQNNAATGVDQEKQDHSQQPYHAGQRPQQVVQTKMFKNEELQQPKQTLQKSNSRSEAGTQGIKIAALGIVQSSQPTKGAQSIQKSGEYRKKTLDKADITKQKFENKVQINKFCDLFSQVNRDVAPMAKGNAFSKDFTIKMENALNHKHERMAKSKGNKPRKPEMMAAQSQKQLQDQLTQQHIQKTMRPDANQYYIRRNIDSVKVLSARSKKAQLFWDTKFIENKLDPGCGCPRGQKMSDDQRNDALGLSARKKSSDFNQDLRFASYAIVDQEYMKQHNGSDSNQDPQLQTFAAEGSNPTQEPVGEPQKPKTKILYSNRASQQLTTLDAEVNRFDTNQDHEIEASAGMFADHKLISNQMPGIRLTFPQSFDKPSQIDSQSKRSVRQERNPLGPGRNQMLFKSSVDSKRSSQDTIRISIKSEEGNDMNYVNRNEMFKYASAVQLDGMPPQAMDDISGCSQDQFDNIDRAAIQMMMGLDSGGGNERLDVAKIVQVEKKNSFSQYSDLLG